MKASIGLALGVVAAMLFGQFRDVDANAQDAFYGINITRLSNYTAEPDHPIVFDHKLFGLDTMWSPADPTTILIPTTGIWRVGADITTLGIAPAYRGYDNRRVIVEIVKNWCGNEAKCPHLGADVVWQRFWNENSLDAFGNSTVSLVNLKQGDRLQILVRGRTQNLLVESNPSNLGTLSPHFYAVLVGR